MSATSIEDAKTKATELKANDIMTILDYLEYELGFAASKLNTDGVFSNVGWAEVPEATIGRNRNVNLV